MFAIRSKLLVVSLAVVIALPLLLTVTAEARGGHGGGGHGGGFHGGFHGGHFHHFGGSRVFIGGFFGFPYYYPYGYYPYPYYYPYYGYPYSYPYAYPDSAYPDTQLPVPSEPQQSYWYYCQDAQGYYPYVRNCPGGWTQVVPTPPEPGKEGVAP